MRLSLPRRPRAERLLPRLSLKSRTPGTKGPGDVSPRGYGGSGWQGRGLPMFQIEKIAVPLRLAGTAVLVTAMSAAGLWASPTQAVERVEDYSVTLSRTPPVEVDVTELSRENVELVRQKCPDAFPPGSPIPRVGVPFLCSDVPLQVADAGMTVSGRAGSSQRDGDFLLTCDFVFPGATDVLVTLGADFSVTDVELVAISGGGPVSCGWTLSFPDGGLSGIAKGSVAMSRVPGEQSIATALDLSVDIVAGSGVYAAAVGGSGRYVDTYAAPFEPEAAATAVGLTGRIVVAEPGELRLKLGRGRSGARIVAPIGSLRAGDPRRLRVVAPARARCSATAARSGSTVRLGRATVVRRTGQAVFPSTLRGKLRSAGTWRVTATCRVGGRSLRSPTAAIRIG